MEGLEVKANVEVTDGIVKVHDVGKAAKFVKKVEHITFSGKEALRRGQQVLFISERAVFELTDDGIKLIELAPGVQLEKDVLGLMEFKPIVDDFDLMATSLFLE